MAQIKYRAEQILGRRDVQQDSVLDTSITEMCDVLAVADGHGEHGHEVSAQLLQDFVTHLRLLYPVDGYRSWEAAVYNLGKAFGRAARACTSEFSGTTFSAIILDWELDRVYTIQVGDSPIYLVTVDAEVKEYLGHNLDQPEMREEVEHNGGTIVKIGGTYYQGNDQHDWGINLGRTVGDHFLGAAACSVPSFDFLPLSSIEGGAVGSDGLFTGKLNPQQVRTALRDSLYEPETLDPKKEWAPFIPQITDEKRAPGDNVSLLRFRVVR